MSISAIYASKGYYMVDHDAAVMDRYSDTKALIEFKFPSVTSIDLDSFQLRGYRKLADALSIPIPAFAVINFHLDANGTPIHAERFPISTRLSPAIKVDSDQLLSMVAHRQYFVVAVNMTATTMLGKPLAMLSEAEFWALHASFVGETRHAEEGLLTATVDCWTPEVRQSARVIQPPAFYKSPIPKPASQPASSTSTTAN